MVPYVIEDSKNGEKVYDLYSRLLKDRIIFVKDDFDDHMANSIVAQMLFLESIDSEKDIYMYINSPGGNVTSMLAIYDVMSYIKPDVVTVGMGQCCSAGSFILAAGTKGKRFALPNTRIMLHEVSGGTGGKINDMKVVYEEITRLYDIMSTHYSIFTGKSQETIKKDLERDFFMSSTEAKDYGIIDEVIHKRPK